MCVTCSKIQKTAYPTLFLFWRLPFNFDESICVSLYSAQESWTMSIIRAFLDSDGIDSESEGTPRRNFGPPPALVQVESGALIQTPFASALRKAQPPRPSSAEFSDRDAPPKAAGGAYWEFLCLEHGIDVTGA
jgi:hypothetical protein